MTYLKNEYAMYKGEELIAIGTIDELAEMRGVKRETIMYYSTPTYAKRVSEKGLRVVKA